MLETVCVYMCVCILYIYIIFFSLWMESISLLKGSTTSISPINNCVTVSVALTLWDVGLIS